MISRISKIIVSLVMCTAVVFLTSCTLGSGTATANTRIVTIQRGDLTEDIVSSGNLALAKTEDLAFQITGFTAVTKPGKNTTTMIAGYVSDVLIEVGDSVKKGQVLAKLDTVDWDSHILDLEDKVTSARRKVTAKERSLAQAQLDLQNAQYNLYIIEDVKKAKNLPERFPLKKANDDLADAQTRLKFAETNLQAAQNAGDIGASNAIREQIKSFNKEIADRQKTLADVLSGHSAALTSDVNSKIRQQNTQIELAKAKILDAQIAIDDAKETVAENQKSLDDARSAQTTIVAPFDGFITQVKVAGGDQVSRGTVAMQIADANKFEAEIQVSEQDIASVKVGGQTRVDVDSMPGVSLPARITSVTPTATIKLGVVNYKVKVALDSNRPVQKTQTGQNQTARSTSSTPVNSQPVQLRQGLSITVYIVVGERNNVVLVPNRAIIRKGKDNLVRVIKDGVVTSRTIKVGINDWQYTEVTDGLSEGEQVVIQQVSSTSPVSSAAAT